MTDKMKLEIARQEFEHIIHALNVAVSGSEHDPSWIRSMFVPTSKRFERVRDALAFAKRGLDDLTAPQQQIPGCISGTAPRGGEPASAAGARGAAPPLNDVSPEDAVRAVRGDTAPANQGGEGRTKEEVESIINAATSAWGDYRAVNRLMFIIDRERANACRAGAEAMRERCACLVWESGDSGSAAAIRALPLPGDGGGT